jgi:predicted acetyltransferase
MNLEVRQAGEAEQSQIEELLNDYLAELSQHREICVGATSAAEYRYLKDYWSDSSRFPFTLWANSELAGFAFVRRTEEDQEPVFQVAEFFVKPKYRRCRGRPCRGNQYLAKVSWSVGTAGDEPQ